MVSLCLSVSLVGHHNIATFVLLVVLPLSYFSPMSGQSYRHSRFNVFFLVTTLSVRDIAVRIRLLIAFKFLVMLSLMSLVLFFSDAHSSHESVDFLDFLWRSSDSLPTMSPLPPPPASPPPFPLLPPHPPILYHYTRRPRPSPPSATFSLCA
jgi:hypothetical protein